MATIKLDPTTHDMVVENGAFADETDLLEEIRQRLKVRLLIIAGEWPHDLTLGIPYLDEPFTDKSPDAQRLAAEFRAVILGTQGVTEILSGPVLELDSSRNLTVTFEAQTDAGVVTFDQEPLQEAA